MRELLSHAYPAARELLPHDQKMFYETWKDNIDPRRIKQKLNEYAQHYIMKNK
jgi:hypothetical protein